MSDDAEGLARISNSIDQGNEIFKSWALEHCGSQISAGGDEGVLCVPATALQDLQEVKSKYESALTLTVSIGIGAKMSQGFQALLASKLRGRNRTTLWDKDVQKEIQEAADSEDDTKKKIVEEYLTKAQAITHTGDGGTPNEYHVQEASANPEMQQAQTLQDFHHQEPEDFEEAFRQLATDNEKKDQAQKASKSQDLNALKQKVAQALEGMHKQLPQLAQIKQASPETYTAVLGVVQGLIAMGRQLQDTDQQLAKAIGASRKAWSGGGSTIPALNTPERKVWDNNYKQAVANYFTEGKPHLLKEIDVPVAKLDRSHSVFGNEAKTRLYHRMVQGGDEMPRILVHPRNGRYKVVDGNRRLDVALANKLDKVRAFVSLAKGIDNFDMSKADLMPGGVADALSPRDFDAEQLAIGTMREMEHTEDENLAREIAMDHLSEDKDYYKEEDKEEAKVEPLTKMALIHNDPDNPMTVYRVQNQYGEGPYTARDLTDVQLPKASFSKRPVPGDDFDPHEFNQNEPDAELRFAFESPQHAQKWFGKDTLKRLDGRGFSVSPVKATRVYRGNSGLQVIFAPHPSETKVQMAKSDWPMSEDKEELDPAEPVVNSKVLDKGTMPEHIQSMRAHHKLVPGQVLDSRHVVVQNASGKNAVREVSAGQQRDLTDSVSNPTGPGQGNPTSARNKPSRT